MMVHHNATRGIFVTTSTYTKNARELALARNIELIEGSQIEHYLNEQTRARIFQEAAVRHQKAEDERLAKQRVQQLHRQYGDFHVSGYPTNRTVTGIKPEHQKTNEELHRLIKKMRDEDMQRSNAVDRQKSEGTGFIVFGILLLAVSVGVLIFSL
jgi:transcriptional regulator of heat shock response